MRISKEETKRLLEIETTTGNRVCAHCKINQPLENYCLNNEHRLGRSYMCRDCRKKFDKEYGLKNKDLLKKKRDKYFQENKKAVYQRNRDRYLAHPEKMKEYYIKNKEKIKRQKETKREQLLIYGKEYREINKEKISEKNKLEYKLNKDKYKKYREENKERMKQFQREYYEKNKENIRIYQKQTKDRINENKRRISTELRKDPLFRLNKSISGAILKALRDNKAGRHWEFITGYTVNILKQHLEILFKSGMTWENMGKGRNKWNIDHIIPLKYKNPDGTYYWNQEELVDDKSETFRKAWALSNLQPLWAIENISKKNNYIGDFREKRESVPSTETLLNHSEPE